jgi:hypothetical protein
MVVHAYNLSYMGDTVRRSTSSTPVQKKITEGGREGRKEGWKNGEGGKEGGRDKNLT